MKTREELKALERHPSTTNVLQWFAVGEHIPAKVKPISRSFEAQAMFLVDNLADSPELTESLRKLLESKDSAVRAAIDALPTSEGDA